MKQRFRVEIDHPQELTVEDIEDSLLAELSRNPQNRPVTVDATKLPPDSAWERHGDYDG